MATPKPDEMLIYDMPRAPDAAVTLDFVFPAVAVGDDFASAVRAVHCFAENPEVLSCNRARVLYVHDEKTHYVAPVVVRCWLRLRAGRYPGSLPPLARYCRRVAFFTVTVLRVSALRLLRSKADVPRRFPRRRSLNQHRISKIVSFPALTPFTPFGASGLWLGSAS